MVSGAFQTEIVAGHWSSCPLPSRLKLKKKKLNQLKPRKWVEYREPRQPRNMQAIIQVQITIGMISIDHQKI